MGARGTVDVSPFRPVVDRAELAFAQDFGYAEAMLRAATAIHKKRDVWECRSRLRESERVARVHCIRDGKDCDSLSPCGFGDCRYATDKNADVVVLSTKGRQYRVPSADPVYPAYDRELVVTYVMWSHRIAS